MKAIVYTQYGPPDVLTLTEVDHPVPKDDEVLVRVRAVSLNDWDLGLINGDFVNRMLNGVRKPKRTIVGSDVAGCVEMAGKSVRNLKPGDEVFGDLSGSWGGLAEYVCANENQLAIKPPTMTFEQAAAIPQAGMLAVQGLIDVGKLRSGQTVLINGAGGGVGTLGVQIARQYDVEITGVDCGPKLEMMRSLGFDHVIDYTREDFTKTGKQYDLILDAKTNRSVFDYLPALNPNGLYVTVGGSIARLLQVVLWNPLISRVYNKKVALVALKANKDLEYMSNLFVSGKLEPVIDGHYTLEQFHEAFTLYAEARQKGKVVISVGEEE